MSIYKSTLNRRDMLLRSAQLWAMSVLINAFDWGVRTAVVVGVLYLTDVL